jgi:heme-degrading monooxygenase HmoA
MQTFWKNKTAPAPPYYAVIFVSEKKEDLDGYEEMNNSAMDGALSMSGCLGYSSVPGTFISYWDNLQSINEWRNNSTHKKAKEQGVKQWYRYYHSLICKVEHSHEFFAGS